MGSWSEVQGEIKQVGSPHDVVRRRCAQSLFDYTGRNVILYYSGWLEKPRPVIEAGIPVEVNDQDKSGFMSTVHGLDRSKGLDLILHTPGGDVAATESIVDYLHSMFDDIRVIVPQLAMSAGTLIALSAREIVMGKHSSLGPVDPQMGGLPAHGIVEEFETARNEIAANPAAIPLWQPIIAKYPPTFIGECMKAIRWADQIAKEWLKAGMFRDQPNADALADGVLKELGSHAETLSHSRHISASKAKALGLNITMLEDDQDLQEHVLTLHHACTQTLSETQAFKIIENHAGVALILAANLKVSA